MWFWMKLSLNFWSVKWLKCLILVGFDDMRYDKGFGEGGIGILLDFVGGLRD